MKVQAAQAQQAAAGAVMEIEMDNGRASEIFGAHFFRVLEGV